MLVLQCAFLHVIVAAAIVTEDTGFSVDVFQSTRTLKEHRERFLPGKARATFVAGQYYCFRIPSLVFHGEELLAFAEGRTGKGDVNKRQGLCFDHGEIHIVWSKSRDLGRSWTGHQVVKDDALQTFGNHIPISFGGKLFLFYCKNNLEVYVMMYDDTGWTSSKRVDLQHVLMAQLPVRPKNAWEWVALGPPSGLVVSLDSPGTSRLLISGNVRFSREFNGPNNGAFVMYMDLKNADVANRCFFHPGGWGFRSGSGRFVGYPKFGRPVIGCIEADFCN